MTGILGSQVLSRDRLAGRLRGAAAGSPALLVAQAGVFVVSTAATIALSQRNSVPDFAAFARWNTCYVLAYAATETWAILLLLGGEGDPGTAGGWLDPAVRALALLRGALVGGLCVIGAAWAFDGARLLVAAALGVLVAFATAWADVCRTAAIARGRVSGAAGADLVAGVVAAGGLLLLLHRPTGGGLDFLIFFAVLMGARAVGQSFPGGGRPRVARLVSLRRPLAVLWRRNYPYTAVVTLARNVDNVVVSAVFGPVALGLYARSFSLLIGPVVQLSTAIAPLAWRQLLRASPASRTDVAPASRTEVVDRWFRVLTVPAYGLVLVSTVGASRLVPIVLGPQWVPAVPAIGLLALCGAALLLQLPALWAAQTGDRGLRPWAFAACELLPLAALGACAPLGFHTALVTYTAVSLAATAALVMVGLGGRPTVRLGRLVALGGLPVLAVAIRLLGLS